MIKTTSFDLLFCWHTICLTLFSVKTICNIGTINYRLLLESGVK